MVKATRKSAVGEAHSKLILMGEHAVVYDHPAIAIPFDTLTVETRVRPTIGKVRFASNFYTGELEDMPEKMYGLAKCIYAVCAKLNQPLEHFYIELNSLIPIGRGLGSSAAIAVSLVRGLYNFFGADLNHEVLMELVDLAEKYAHGTPSGIDREATSQDYPIFFRRNELTEQVKIARPLHIVVADTGRIGDTHASVSSVKDRYETNYSETKARLARIGSLTVQARQAMETGELIELGEQLDQAHVELKALGVSDPGLDHYVEASKAAGALGAKLTGGGRGGCMFALSDSFEQARLIENALKDAGASQTWYCQIVDEVMSYEG
ncbi:mevalonate kinase [Amphibacillus sp. MSJ-3]|uniref:mevalonate kinase n=1 Tax=Amphibacillus sp. MSJ-3 TaxID=2841505 RepID=UPI001C0F2035|nr:mevalonate kinase [Amphibacillus sp. MSJ-3]MBU5594754.1 mevalonate kinase [Amphibacillus sp. MSJ-3]